VVLLLHYSLFQLAQALKAFQMEVAGQRLNWADRAQACTCKCCTTLHAAVTAADVTAHMSQLWLPLLQTPYVTAATDDTTTIAKVG
jgi:hypothetical protein